MTAASSKKMKFNRNEIEIIQLLASGKTPAGIAKHYRCSESAVSQWRRSARNYAEVKTDAQLVALAIRQGIIA